MVTAVRSPSRVTNASSGSGINWVKKALPFNCPPGISSGLPVKSDSCTHAQLEYDGHRTSYLLKGRLATSPPLRLRRPIRSGNTQVILGSNPLVNGKPEKWRLVREGLLAASQT